MATTTKEQLHRLIDALPEVDLELAQQLLEKLKNETADPVVKAFMSAPEDDEPVTAEDEAAIAEARRTILDGNVRSWEQVRAELLPHN